MAWLFLDPADYAKMCEPPQLQETLTQRQEELVTLQESNMQLKELVSWARQLAAVLDMIALLPQCADGAALPPLPLLPPPPPRPAAGAGADGRPWEEATGVDAVLQEVSEKCRAALRSLGGSPMAKRPRPTPRLLGTFRGLHTGRAVPRAGGGGLEGGGSLRAALGEASGIRTLAFPQGNAFTLCTAAADPNKKKDCNYYSVGRIKSHSGPGSGGSGPDPGGSGPGSGVSGPDPGGTSYVT
ncbi:LOW QUALITY PROTEIN: multicilin-like [Nyctibius grandis]|uniref:LOW QUALITY PROTEIN: multicilin-like n=1 Tax=Nyctibius grandis TaxID=48427 RepID=UPI0035BC2ACD